MTGTEAIWLNELLPQWLKASETYSEACQAIKQSGIDCAYCGDLAETVDHVFPRWLGGTDDDYNLVPVCRPCNRWKAGRLAGEWYTAVEQKRDKLARSMTRDERFLLGETDEIHRLEVMMNNILIVIRWSIGDHWLTVVR